MIKMSIEDKLEITANKAQRQHRKIQKDLQMIDKAIFLFDTKTASDISAKIVIKAKKMSLLLQECTELMKNIHYAH
jgi:hypothetical protein